MLLYSILYSLEDATKNKYINMFLLLKHTLQTTFTYDPKVDSYYLLCDADTQKVLENQKGTRDLNYLTIPKPTTHLEGMLWKYKLQSLLDIEGKDCMYLDVDMLSVRPLRFFPQKDRLYALPEGNPSNENYCGSFELDAQYGFSAGWFVFNFGSTVRAIFDKVLKLADECKDKFYTVEQPFFNKAIEKTGTYICRPSIVSFNGNNYLDECRFISYAGEPGNAEFHWNKGFQLYMRLFRT